MKPADRMEIRPGVEVAVFYPDLLYAPLETVATTPGAELAEVVLERWPRPAHATNLSMPGVEAADFPLASLIVSMDPAARFRPDMVMREPIEVQVWPDGALTFEIEYTGVDIREEPDGAAVSSAVLSEWADAWRTRLLTVFNDAGRSLPDVWNARFTVPDAAAPIGEIVELAQRGIRVAEGHRYGVRSAAHLLSLLRTGDAHAVAAVPPTPLLMLRGDLPADDDEHRFAIAADVCALANAPHGGVLVFGVAEHGSPGGRVRAVELDGAVERVAAAVAAAVFPAPEDLTIEAVPVAGDVGRGLIVVAVPRQDRSLKPFLVHGARVSGHTASQFVSIVERRGTEIHIKNIAALHAEIATGRAVLRGTPDG